MSIEFNEDALLAGIRSRPFLWDGSSKRHNQNIIRDNWFDLAKITIPNFEEFHTSKQSDLVYQVRRRWQCYRATYRLSLQRRTNHPQAEQLSFLDEVFQDIIDANSREDSVPLSAMLNNGKRSASKGIKRVSAPKERHSLHRKKVSFGGKNSRKTIETTYADPVLSIPKVDEIPRRRVGRPSKVRKPSSYGVPKEQMEEASVMQPQPKPREHIAAARRAENSIVYYVSDDDDYDDDEDETSDESADSKRCKYRYEVQMSSAPRNTHPRQTSAVATLSFENRNPFGRRKVSPSHYYENEEKRSRSYNGVQMTESLPFNGSMLNNPGSHSRRDESFRDSRNYAMIPAAPVDYDDEDLAFFRSLLTWTRHFNESEKLEFRTEIMRLISRIRNNETTDDYYVLSQTPL